MTSPRTTEALRETIALGCDDSVPRDLLVATWSGLPHEMYRVGYGVAGRGPEHENPRWEDE